MLNTESVPDVVCIGFFCHDVHKDGFILGGTASYSSLVFQKLGKQTAVLTSVGKDFLFFDRFKKAGIQIHNKIAARTTTFENIYEAEHIRVQYISSRAMTLTAKDVPVHWCKTPVVKLCLIADEADASLLASFPNALIGATIQGWLRQWDTTGKVSPKAMDWELLRSIDVVLFSEEDIIGFEDRLPIIIEYASVVVMTKGKHGATIFYSNEVFDFPSFPIEEIDPTGAGDVFAAAFLYHFSINKDIALAAAYAHSTASFVVEKKGVQLPSKGAIEDRFLTYQKLFFTRD